MSLFKTPSHLGKSRYLIITNANYKYILKDNMYLYIYIYG